MRCARAVFLCLPAALALSGCMGRSGPVVMVQPQDELDSLAYGPTVPAARSARSQVATVQPTAVYAGPPGRGL